MLLLFFSRGNFINRVISAIFQAPLGPLSNYPPPSAAAAVIRSVTTSSSATTSTTLTSSTTHPPPPSLAGVSPVIMNQNLITPAATAAATSSTTPTTTRPSPPPPPLTISGATPLVHSPSPSTGSAKDNNAPACSSAASSTGGVSPTHSQSGSDYPLSTSPLQLTPVLVETQIIRIAETAASIVKALPPEIEVKTPNNKKKISKELEQYQFVTSLRDDDVRKMEEIRRFSAIYGRYDCKRKPEKPLTLHEVRFLRKLH